MAEQKLAFLKKRGRDRPCRFIVEASAPSQVNGMPRKFSIACMFDQAKVRSNVKLEFCILVNRCHGIAQLVEDVGTIWYP